ncbi:aldose 1-epimerase family protein [Alicyclobacillus tolerans]|uniref:aldose 1-epimerase family protein n=1 Tax=Alicyclobacillus tolerans TaxID=90970 RepID=UPI001F20634B|nr:aldose 1-epimerase family protein [Alicyclobacillus tolerans]MCF8567955.1 aldose 1-epimerase family protein [Alicyclobacillus tolerans]
MPILYGREYTKDELLTRVGHIHQIAGIAKYEAQDGVARGNRVLQVKTGSGLEFNIVPDKGMDITDVMFKGIPCVWRSANGDVAPSFFDSTGLGWLRSFQGGLFSTCGLTHFGSPCTDDGEELGIHGRIGNLPAYDVSSASTWVDDDLVFQVKGFVRQTRVFGENLVLSRTITTRLGGTEIGIEDVVTNEGFSHTPHMMLYHFNLGFPLIGEQSTLSIKAKNTTARDEEAEKGLSECFCFSPPLAGFQEQVFHHDVEDQDDVVSVEVCNPELRMNLKLEYRKSQLPHLFQWRMYGQGTYVLGLEPASSSAIQGRATAREKGDLEFLAPGMSKTYHLKVSLMDGCTQSK